MSSPAPIRHAPPLLWAAARVLIGTIFALFGDPSHIAWQHTHRKAERTLLLKWLRAGEALMRHLLLIEASHSARPNTRPILHAARPKRVRRLMAFTPDKPEDWRVSFRCFSCLDRRRLAGDPSRSCRSRAGGGAGGPSKLQLDRHDRWHQARWPKPTFYSAWPLAERAEAMLRAFNNPAPYARRLARRLHATPHRSVELVRDQRTFEHLIPESDFIAVRQTITTARRRFESG